MPNYKVVDADKLDSDMTIVADAIRERAGISGKMEFPNGMAETVRSRLADLTEIGDLHFWRKYNGKPTNNYAEKEVTNIQFEVSTKSYTSTTTKPLYYGSSFSFDEETGQFELVSDGNCSTLEKAQEMLPGKYVRHNTNYSVLYYIPSDATITESSTSVSVVTTKYIKISKATKYIAIEIHGYAASQESDAYPTNGEHTDGYWYEYGGLLADALGG